MLFGLGTSPYWDTHYIFGKETKKRKKYLGTTAYLSLLINTIVVFAFAYGKSKGNDKLMNNAISLLENTTVENNSIIRKWKLAGVVPRNASETQALLQLKNEYCNYRRCLNCGIGSKFITNKK